MRFSDEAVAVNLPGHGGTLAVQLTRPAIAAFRLVLIGMPALRAAVVSAVQ